MGSTLDMDSVGAAREAATEIFNIIEKVYKYSEQIIMHEVSIHRLLLLTTQGQYLITYLMISDYVMFTSLIHPD